MVSYMQKWGMKKKRDYEPLLHKIPIANKLLQGNMHQKEDRVRILVMGMDQTDK